jgi:PhnB protein
MPDGTVGHCELDLGTSKLMLAEENEQWGTLSPETIGGSPVLLCLYVEDVDKVFEAALRAGGRVLGDMVVRDQFHGDRSGTLADPFGHIWTIMTHIEDVNFPELQRRAEKMFSK